MSTVTEAVEFTAFPKIARLNRTVIVTEKIDGTNAAVGVTETGQVYAQSRKRLITPEADNFGFARWVQEHADELRDGLGVGLHFGEWWGLGIQRGYGLDHKRFSLFNVSRWNEEDPAPACCHVIPRLDIWGQFDSGRLDITLAHLDAFGSVAAPGFMEPEGVVVYHTAGRQLFKVTLDNDAQPKGTV